MTPENGETLGSGKRSESESTESGESSAYAIREDTAGADRYRVEDANGVAVIVCSGRHNAEHYATLLNQAYERGFKAGRRSTRT